VKNEPFVSIITPMYNAEKYIAQTIDSVIKQTYQKWEMIIVDNCSTDNSRIIVNQISDDRIKLIELEYNSGGPARPRNIGLDNAQGEFIAFLDADDVWLPEKLEKQIKFIQKDDVDIVHTLANVVDDKGNYMMTFKNQRIFNILKFIISKDNILFYTNNININSVLMKKNNIRFDEDVNLITLEDWRYWIDCKNSNLSINLCKEVLINYRVHIASISSRSTDAGYRKAIYMLSKLFLRKEIPLRHYLFSNLFYILKILRKNV